MSDWKDDKEKLFNESINGVKEVTVGMLYGDRIESLLSKQRAELVEKVNKLEPAKRAGYIMHPNWLDRYDVIALIKDTNEVAEEENK